MFNTWLKTHSPADFPLDQRLFPKAADREYWEQYLGDAQIRDAEAYLNYEWPMIRARHFMAFQQTGDRMVQEDPHFARRKALQALFLGELAEHKGRFLPDLCDGLFAICEETYWGLSAHYPITRADDLLPSAADPYIDLFAAETAELLSVIYHILYDEINRFCPQMPERLEYELERRILTPYCNRGDFWWMGNTPKKPNNWTPWILENVLTVFVCVPISPTRLHFGLAKMLTEIQRYYDILPADGGCDEGSSYWTKAGAKLFLFCDVLYRTSGGRIDFFGDEKLRQIGLFEARVYIGKTRFVNFSDGAASILNQSIDYVLYGFGLRAGEESLCRFAATLNQDQAAALSGCLPAARNQAGIKEQLFSLIYARDIAAQPPFVPEEVCVLPDLQTAYLRQGGWYAAIKGGHNGEGHNHNDVASFLAYYDSDPVLVDPGIGTYTKQTFSDRRYELPGVQSAYHNLPLINGQQQQNGPEFRADRFEAEGKTVTVSFAGAYPESAGVTEALRTLQLHEGGIDLRDVFTPACQVTEHFLTPLAVEIRGDTAILGGKFALRAEGAAITVDQMDFAGDEKYIRAWHCPALNRIRFTLPKSETTVTLRRLP